MVASTLGAADAGSSKRELAELRSEAVRPVAVLALVVAVLLLMGAALSPDPFTWGAFSFGLGLIALAANWLANERAGAAALLLSAGFMALVGVAVTLHPTSPLGSLFGPAVVAAAILLGWRFALGGAVVASALLLAHQAAARWLLDEPTLLPLAVIWLCVAVGWLALRPLSTAVHWSWTSYAAAREKAEEARGHRQQLVEALKSLDAAYNRLEIANAELARARRAAEEARRIKDEFAATISHELRTPLNLIVGFAEMMALRPESVYGEPLPTACRGDVEAIYRNAAHILSLIDDVLDLARVEARRMPLRRQLTDVRKVVEEAAAAVRSLLRDKHLNLAVYVQPDIPIIRIDPVRVRQVIINLLNNAARCTDEGGIEVDVRRLGNDVVVSVADTGTGIPADDLEHIFDEFRQAGEVSRQQTGSGLGLAICRRFVEMHGGSIWAESPPGVGSTFQFSLPIADSVVALPSTPDLDRLVRPETLAVAGRTVAVVGGPEAVRAFQRCLDDYKLVAASAGAEGAVAWDEEEPRTTSGVRPAALLVTDRSRITKGFRMPLGMPVVTCELQTTAGRAWELGLVDYLMKPITGHQLHVVLEHVAKPVRSVLVVDDDPGMVKLVERMIESLTPPRRVLKAYGGAEALVALREQRPDLVLLDLRMPGLDGYQVLEIMRNDERLRSIPVVAVSAQEPTDDLVAAGTVGVTREGGLSTEEALCCVRSLLNELLDDGAPKDRLHS